MKCDDLLLVGHTLFEIQLEPKGEPILVQRESKARILRVNAYRNELVVNQFVSYESEIPIVHVYVRVRRRH